MDPNATVAAMNNAETFVEAKEHARNLRIWLNRGGFQPDWNCMTEQGWQALMAVDAGYARIKRNQIRNQPN